MYEGQKISVLKPSKVAKSISPVVLKKQPLMRMQDFPSADGEKSSVRSSEGGLKTFLTKNTAASRLAAKSSAVRSSCHDACKFGHHHAFQEPETAKSGAKSTAKKPSKVSTAKVSRPAVAAKIVKSPVKLPDSGASGKKSGAKLISGGQKLSSGIKSVDKFNSVAKSGKKLNSVNKSGEKTSSTDKSGGNLSSFSKSSGRLSLANGNAQLSGEKSVRSNMSTPESKFKVTRSLFRSPRPSGSENLKILTSKISMDDIFSPSVNFQPKAARSLIPAFESPRFSSLPSFKILDDKAEEEFFRQFSPLENVAKSHDEISFEAFSGEQSSDYSEISPRSLEAYVQEAYDYVGKNNAENSAESVKMRFRRRRELDRDSNLGPPESVVLRHQDVQGRKASEDYLINHAIEEAVSKLSHTQESKVKVLVGAFETVMNLKDSQNADNDHKHAVD